MPSLSTTQRIAIVAALVVVIGATLLLRWGQPISSGSPTPSATTVPATAATGSVPVFTSARFQSGELMGALGPEWTFLKQDDMTDSPAFVPLKGMKWIRETDVKLIGKDTALTMDEFTVMDAAAIKQSLSDTKSQPANVGGRDGYIVPLGDITGGTGFAIIGQDSVLLVHYSNGGAWPTEVPPEIKSFIVAANVL